MACKMIYINKNELPGGVCSLANFGSDHTH